MSSNKERRQNNIGIATGRISGKFIEDGIPRGGGNYAKEVYEVRIPPKNLSIDEVFNQLGIADVQSGVPRPGNDAAGTDTSICYQHRTIHFDRFGRLIGETVVPITKEQYEQVKEDIVRID